MIVDLLHPDRPIVLEDYEHRRRFNIIGEIFKVDMEASEESATAPTQEASGPQSAVQDSPSLEKQFLGCVSHLTEFEKQYAGEDSAQFKSLIRRIDDSYFRLQIWGSDIGANSKDKITFDGILNFTSGPMHGIIKDILARFNRSFAAIEEALDAVTPVGVVSAMTRYLLDVIAQQS